MTGIFISYRRSDSQAWAIGLHEDLVRIFGDDRVFLDNDSIHAGDWREQIHNALDRCKVVLVVIGRNWLTTADEKSRPRIQLADDVHHQEVALALERSGVTVIPVLVDEAPMPRADQLPRDLRRLPNQQARKIGDTRARRKADLAVLIEDIRTIGGLEPLPVAGGEPPSVGQDSVAGPKSWLADSIWAAALSVIAAMGWYLVDLPLNFSETLFLFVFFYALVFLFRRVRARLTKAGRDNS